jgi:hypothetical protein
LPAAAAAGWAGGGGAVLCHQAAVRLECRDMRNNQQVRGEHGTQQGAGSWQSNARVQQLLLLNFNYEC